jgi:uroporphyrinogen-III synthase
MAILVTRPAHDGEKTAEALRKRGYKPLLSPALRFETMAIHDDHGANYDAVVLTSANAARAIDANPFKAKLLNLPVFVVGEHTAEVARAAGFENIINANGDANALRDLVVKSASGKIIKKNATLCYISGADLARDIASELGECGFTVITHTAYRMIPVTSLSDEVSDAFRNGGVDAVLHFSRRSARAFLAAARHSGVEVSALALPQCCISDAVAAIVREGGALQVQVARAPNEDAVLDTLKLLNIAPG